MAIHIPVTDRSTGTWCLDGCEAHEIHGEYWGEWQHDCFEDNDFSHHQFDQGTRVDVGVGMLQVDEDTPEHYECNICGTTLIPGVDYPTEEN